MDYYMSIVTVFMVTISSAVTTENNGTQNGTTLFEREEDETRNRQKEYWTSYHRFLYGVALVYAFSGVCVVTLCCFCCIRMNFRCGRRPEGSEHLAAIIQQSGAPAGAGLALDFPLILMNLGTQGAPNNTTESRSSGQYPMNTMTKSPAYSDEPEYLPQNTPSPNGTR